MNKHEQSQRMVEALAVGDRIHVKSGAGTGTIIGMGPVQNADSSCYAGRTVLHTTGDKFFPFATHTLYYQDDGPVQGWMMTGGQSFKSLTGGVEAFNQMTRTFA